MNVFINLTSVAYPMTGIGHYTFNLTKELLDSSKVQNLAGIYHGNLLSHEQIEKLVEAPPASTNPRGGIAALARKVAAITPFSRLAYYKYRAVVMKRHQSMLRNFIYWEPNFIALPYHGAQVTTVHDLSHLAHPDFHPAERVSVLNRYLSASIQRSNRIITVSSASRAEIEQHFQPTCDIDIIPPGVGNEFRSVSEAQIQSCRKAYQLPPRFILSVATLEPRKNLPRLIDAFEQLPESIRQTYPLVVCGARGWQSHQLRQKLATLQQKHQAYCLGYVDQHHLPALYAAASLCAYVSLYEGFGMPVAESMAAGTAVLTSCASSMPEVAGDAAMLVPPQDTQAITQALQTLLENNTLRQKLADKGKQHSQRFTWHQSGQQLLQTLDAARMPSTLARTETQTL
jgi:alpha-1,3-rhamnosyl/mannosyltransferase